jgi:5'-nucleotidase (lipoprotein e(P4) family)
MTSRREAVGWMALGAASAAVSAAARAAGLTDLGLERADADGGTSPAGAPAADPAPAPGLEGDSLSGVPSSDPLHNPLLWAVAWKQTAAEYAALCHQGYNLARMLLNQALARRAAEGAHAASAGPSAGPAPRPLAIITDVDDTIVHAGAYWAKLIEEGFDFFDDDLWDAWIPTNQVTPVPGALDFFRYAASQGVEIFYITNREQGEGTEAYALAHLELLGFPFADMEHLTVLRDTSNKEPARERIAEAFDVVLLLGDNLNDFRRVYYVDDVAERMARMEADRDQFGTRFIVFPNPTDGHWVRAIFGDSEPPPTDENRRRLREAALGRS